MRQILRLNNRKGFQIGGKSGRAKLASEASTVLETRKAELDKLPENFGRNLIAVSKLFAEQYHLQKPGIVNVTDLLRWTEGKGF